MPFAFFLFKQPVWMLVAFTVFQRPLVRLHQDMRASVYAWRLATVVVVSCVTAVLCTRFPVRNLSGYQTY